mmetsp:Transcript_20636/g.58525  ORF Transcript_20636/g.58525 Transcript_20636/m.58525 type:complete len:201 (+) Transcript_20636:1-603(+)
MGRCFSSLASGAPNGAARRVGSVGAMADFTVEMQIQISSSDTGVVQLLVHPSWAPLGAARFKELVECGFYNNARWHRVIAGFIAQVGIAADPEVYKKWGYNPIKDDPVTKSNIRGTVSYAKRNEPDARSCQIFVNYTDNSHSLDNTGFAPFAEVISGMEVIDKLQVSENIDQGMFKEMGNAYLDRECPGKLSEILEAKIV